jgi:hypothetical protein
MNARGTRILPGAGPNTSPTPDVTIEYSGDLRFREIRVYNPRALMAPLAGRIGRHIADVLPPCLANVVQASASSAREERRMMVGNYRWPNGNLSRFAVIVPDPDCVIVSVTRVQ